MRFHNSHGRDPNRFNSDERRQLFWFEQFYLEISIRWITVSNYWMAIGGFGVGRRYFPRAPLALLENCRFVTSTPFTCPDQVWESNVWCYVSENLCLLERLLNVVGEMIKAIESIQTSLMAPLKAPKCGMSDVKMVDSSSEITIVRIEFAFHSNAWQSSSCIYRMTGRQCLAKWTICSRNEKMSDTQWIASR